jgi:hypothetical protein
MFLLVISVHPFAVAVPLSREVGVFDFEGEACGERKGISLRQLVEAELERARTDPTGRMPNVIQLSDALAIAYYRSWLLAILLSLLPNHASL